MIETIDHIVWDCSKAQKAWIAWIEKWAGRHSQPDQLNELREAAAARKAPAIQKAFLATAQQCIGRWTPITPRQWCFCGTYGVQSPRYCCGGYETRRSTKAQLNRNKKHKQPFTRQAHIKSKPSPAHGRKKQQRGSKGCA